MRRPFKFLSPWLGRLLSLARTGTRNDRFRIINIETFGYCNRRCDFCFNGERFRKRDLGVMDEAVWRKIVDELGSIGFDGRLSPHFYGEPLLDDRLPALISHARSRCPRARIRVNSNGDKLDETVLKRFLENGMDCILVTNYGATDNLTCRDLSIKYPSHVIYRRHQHLFKANRAGKLFAQADTLDSEPCLRPSQRLVVNWKGHVVLCCNDFYEGHVFGDLKTESVMDVWSKPEFVEVRDRLARRGGRRTIAICKGCNQR